jgi:O-antigen/teichoic acid export membrane protein
MLSFSGWNLYGNMMLTISQQGQNVLLNRFFGTIINAASGIALQIQATLFAFIGNIAFAFRPQIVKEYAKNNYQRVNDLVFLASKFSAISTLLISIPIIYNMHYLMSLWLAKVPSGSVEICQLLLITNFFNSFNPSSYNAITATGKLGLVNILSGTFFLLQLPLIYIILHYTHSYYNVYLLGITIPIITCIMYIYVLKKYVNIFNAKGFVVNIMIPTTIIGLLDAVIIYCCGKLGMNNLFLFVIDIIISSLIIILLSYLWILDRHEKFVLLSYIKSKF